MAKIALEDNLNHMSSYLQSNGHEVVSMNNLADCDCCVISGQDNNVMGISDTATKASVINAQGMSDSEILQQINETVGKIQ